jgi:hypothetical protein
MVDEPRRRRDPDTADLEQTHLLSSVDVTRAVFVDTTGRRRHMIFASVLAVEAYLSAQFAPDNQQQTEVSGDVPENVRNGGPIVDPTGGQVRSYPMPPKTIALTFDDGPDPLWTPRVLRVLDQYRVKATFFVVGSHVTRSPDLVRRLTAEGHELGIHTFTHPRLSGLGRWRRELEYSQTQQALRNLMVGVRSNLVCPIASIRPALLADELARLPEPEAERRRGCVLIRQASLLRTQLKADLNMHFGFHYYSDLRPDDRAFLRSCGLSPWRMPWRRRLFGPSGRSGPNPCVCSGCPSK